MGASGELGAPCSGTADGGKREMEPLWNEATMIASSWPVMGRPLRKEAQMSVESGVGATSTKMALEPLREEALT